MNLELMKSLCKMEIPQLYKILIKFLEEEGYEKIITDDNFILAEGQLPVCLLAHIDTVWNRPPQNFFFDNEQSVLWSPQGLGADDRAGVYAIINLVKRGYRPHIIFTDSEEIGGLGAEDLIRKFNKCPFEKCNALIELDRQGKDEVVFYSCDNKKFEKLINSYGFVTKQGSFSDISLIAPIWGIAACNLSVGYYLEHSLGEHLNINELNNIIDKVVIMMRECTNWKFYKYIPRKIKINKVKWNQGICVNCGKRIMLHEAHKVGEDYIKGIEHSVYLCNGCYNQYVKEFI